MSSTVFVLVALVFLCRFDKVTVEEMGYAPPVTMILAVCFAAVWDIHSIMSGG